MGCQRSITGRFLGFMIASMLVLTGCIGSAREKDEAKEWSGVESCVLLSVDNSFGGHTSSRQREYTVWEMKRMN